jgi:nucleoside transporter
MTPAVRAKLSVMMFLQYFVWGAWYVTMATYLLKTLQFSGQENGLAYSTTAIAAMVSPFFIGLVADRFFATERVLGLLHLVGAALLFWVSTLTHFHDFYPVLVGYTLCYMPTIALTNSLSFHQMDEPGREFPGIRVLGTIGWIAAGFVISALGAEANAVQFRVAAAASAALGLFSFVLPYTPPARTGRKTTMRDILGLDAIGLMRERSFRVFVLGSFLICIPLQFYYAFTNPYLTELGITNTAALQTIGQMSEIAFMLVMPFFFARLGVKWMLIVGMLAWSLRYVLFAYGDGAALAWMVYLGIAVHGICYDFFFVTGQIYVDKKASVHIRAAAQGFISFVTYGVGMFFGSYLAGWIVDQYTYTQDGATLHTWQPIWIVPAAFSAAVLLLFAAFFRYREESRSRAAA